MLTLIIGPMKSAKSLELIARALPHRYAGKRVVFIKPDRDIRTDTVASRVGVKNDAISLESLSEAPRADVYAIDEVHMFLPDSTYQSVYNWLYDGKEVICSGLNTDHAGRLMPTVARLLELSPEILLNKQAVCEICGDAATHTQVMAADGVVIDKSYPPEVPDDGTFIYEARCRNCFC